MDDTLFDTVARREEPIENIVGEKRGKIETRLAGFTSPVALKTSQNFYSLPTNAKMLRRSFRARQHNPVSALDACRLALASAQVVQFRAPHLAPAHHLNRADHRRVHGENPLDAHA